MAHLSNPGTPVTGGAFSVTEFWQYCLENDEVMSDLKFCKITDDIGGGRSFLTSSSIKQKSKFLFIILFILIVNYLSCTLDVLQETSCRNIKF